jgi:hypothetical protein
MATVGNSFWKACRMRTSLQVENITSTTSDTSASSPADSALARARMPSTLSETARASASSALPASVSVGLRLLRSSSATLSCSSRLAMV